MDSSWQLAEPLVAEKPPPVDAVVVEAIAVDAEAVETGPVGATPDAGRVDGFLLDTQQAEVFLRGKCFEGMGCFVRNLFF